MYQLYFTDLFHTGENELNETTWDIYWILYPWGEPAIFVDYIFRFEDNR